MIHLILLISMILKHLYSDPLDIFVDGINFFIAFIQSQKS